MAQRNQKPLFLMMIITLGAIGVFLTTPSLLKSGKTTTESSTKTVKTPAFILENLDGEMVSLADFKGKTVLVNLWAEWCPPCVKEIPDLIKLRETYKDKNFEMIGLVVPIRFNKEKTIKKVEALKITYPIVWGTLEAMEEFGTINSIPRTFILNKTGEIVEDVTGLNTYKSFEALVTKHLD